CAECAHKYIHNALLRLFSDYASQMGLCWPIHRRQPPMFQATFSSPYRSSFPHYHPPVILNPRLSHHRSPLHMHLDWDTAQSPLLALQVYGSASRSIESSFQLYQYAMSPPRKSLLLVFFGSAASRLERWDTIHVAREDGKVLRVGDVLNAIHIHLTQLLTRNEINNLSTDEWVRVEQAFQRRVAATRARGDMSELKMQRLDFLDGHTLFDGIQYFSGEFVLSLCTA
ncbi:hypothetical protein GGX14DRAFT_482605, partial [Mycena pura]